MDIRSLEVGDFFRYQSSKRTHQVLQIANNNPYDNSVVCVSVQTGRVFLETKESCEIVKRIAKHDKTIPYFEDSKLKITPPGFTINPESDSVRKFRAEVKMLDDDVPF